MESAPAKARGHPKDVDASQLHGQVRRLLPGNALAKGAKAPATMPGEKTPSEKKRTLDAQMARARLRRGAMLERLQERLSQGDPSGEDQGIQPRLNAKQLRVLREYQSGELRKEANRLTMISGHRRLKREDHTYVDIGGSTGGFVRTVLDDWEPPDLAEFADDP